MGAGEILINSIDKDGSARGFDEELLNFVNDNTSLPKFFVAELVLVMTL